jgi:hypothetical protein
MMRLIQHGILKFQGKDTTNTDGWESGLSVKRIQNALDSWRVDALPGGFHRLTRPNADMRLILESMGLDADLRLPTATDLRKLKKAVDRIGMP